MATDPDGDVVDHLDTSVGYLTKDTNLFASKEQAAGDYIPHNSVFVLASGGPAPEAYVAGDTGDEQRFSALQIIIRSDPRDYNTGVTNARTVRDALHHATISGYVDVRVNETEPLYIGENDVGAHIWTTNLELWHEE